MSPCARFVTSSTWITHHGRRRARAYRSSLRALAKIFDLAATLETKRQGHEHALAEITGIAAAAFGQVQHAALTGIPGSVRMPWNSCWPTPWR